MPNFIDAIGVEWVEMTPARVVGRVVIGDQHLQPYGIVHGGLYASVAESAASLGAHLSAVSRDADAGAVGLENCTTFLRAARLGTTVLVEAEPLQAGRRAQAWEVRMSDAESGKLLARSSVRLMVVRPDTLA